MGLRQKILKFSVIGLHAQPLDILPTFGLGLFKPCVLKSKVEICRAADILVGIHELIALCLVQGAGTFTVGITDLALLIEEVAEPVILATVIIDGFLHGSRNRELVAQVDDLLGTFDDPGKNALSGILREVIAVVLDIAVALNLGIEGNDDQTAPGAIIGCTDLRQMVGVQHQAVAGRKAEGVFLLFLRKDVIGGAEMIDGGIVQPSAFLHLSGNK